MFHSQLFIFCLTDKNSTFSPFYCKVHPVHANQQWMKRKLWIGNLHYCMGLVKNLCLELGSAYILFLSVIDLSKNYIIKENSRHENDKIVITNKSLNTKWTCNKPIVYGMQRFVLVSKLVFVGIIERYISIVTKSKSFSIPKYILTKSNSLNECRYIMRLDFL